MVRRGGAPLQGKQGAPLVPECPRTLGPGAATLQRRNAPVHRHRMDVPPLLQCPHYSERWPVQCLQFCNEAHLAAWSGCSQRHNLSRELRDKP